MEKCQKISHTIKGLAGNLSAEDLYIKSQDLEREFRNGNFNNESLSAFEQSINTVMKTLEQLETNTILVNKSLATEQTDSIALLKQLDKMKKLLLAGDFEAVSCLQDIETILNTKQHKFYEQLEAKAMSFNFNAALETLELLYTEVQAQENKLGDGGK